MQINNLFDAHIQLHSSRMPPLLRDRAIELCDELDLCWLIARSVFEERAEPAQAIALCEQLRQRMAPTG